MTRPRVRTMPVAVVMILTALLTGCALFPGRENEVNVKTPTQARQELARELTAIAAEVLPGGEVSPDPGNPPSGCGGSAGTTEEKLLTEVSVGIVDSGLTAAHDEIITRARQALTKRGWTVLRAENYNDHPSLAFQKEDGAGGELVYAPKAKGLTIDAHTACLPNPDFEP